MPFSTTGDTIDFVYGVINWKEVASRALTDTLAIEVGIAMEKARSSIPSAQIWADGPSHPQDGEPLTHPAPFAPEHLDGWLAQARQGVGALAEADRRSQQLLYRAVGQSLDYAHAVRRDPGLHSAQLAAAGIRPKGNAMGIVAKLVFGTHKDKARFADIVVALETGDALGMDGMALTAYLDAFPGGLKALARDARTARGKAFVGAPSTTDK